MTDRYLGRAVIGPIIPDRGDIDDVPMPYKATVIQARLLSKLKGSQLVEPGEVVTPPITEEPTP